MSSDHPAPLLVTGANGHQGLSLARAIGTPGALRAVVRSPRAAAAIEALPEACRPTIHQADPRDAAALTEIARGCEAWVHLVGILKETKSASYEDAHERSAEVVRDAAAAAGIRRIVYLSILGSTPDASNACLRSKGRAEQILMDGDVPTTVLRVPMVLGPGEIAAGALRGKAGAPFVLLARGGRSLEQPIDSDDVVAAIRAAASDTSAESRALDLAGPESLPHRELVGRVAQRLGTAPRVVPIPLWLVQCFVALLSLLPSPPVTQAMLGVLEHDDDVDPGPACAQLGLTLTALDTTLDRTFAPDQEDSA